MMARTEKEKMLAGELYNADTPELQAEMAITHRWLATGPASRSCRQTAVQR